MGLHLPTLDVLNLVVLIQPAWAVKCSQSHPYWTYRLHARDMSLISLVASHQQKIGFAPTASMAGLGEKLGMDPQIGQLVCCGLCQELFLSGAVVLLKLCWRLCERLLCVDRVRYIWSGTIRRLSVGCMWRVGRVSPVGCTSIRIAATLGYE
jgi:hypothetical protein